MAHQMILVTLVIQLIIICLYTAGSKHCSSGEKGGDISIVVMSNRNSTGHRNVKAQVFSPDDTQEQSGNPGEVAIHVTVSSNLVEGARRQCITASFSIPEARQAPAGYELAPGLGWYRLHLEPLSWMEAKTACEEEGAHLAVINSQKEADVLKTLFARAPQTIPNATYNSRAFVGFSDIIEGQYVTLFGEPLSEAGYEAWHPGQPDNMHATMDPESDCGAIERKTGLLNDLQCNSRNAYFCEIHI